MSHPDPRATLFAGQLRVADGYIGLGMWLEANDALENIDADLRATVEVLERREKIYAALEKPDLLEVVRDALARAKK